MAAARGLGGAFLKVKDPEALYQWYEKHLGLKRTHGCFIFRDEEQTNGATVVTFFPADTKYFGPGEQRSMLNFRVDSLDLLVEQLTAAGVEVDPQRPSDDYGKFAWIVDPEGNRVELWEPAKKN